MAIATSAAAHLRRSPLAFGVNMSWRSGSKLFIEIWPAIQSSIPDRQHRIEFTGELLKLFVKCDMDPYDVEDVHPDIRAAMRHVGLEIAEPEHYRGEQTGSSEPRDCVSVASLASVARGR